MADLEQKIRAVFEVDSTAIDAGMAAVDAKATGVSKAFAGIAIEAQKVPVVEARVSTALDEQNAALRRQQTIRKDITESAERLARIEQARGMFGGMVGGGPSGFGGLAGAPGGLSGFGAGLMPERPGFHIIANDIGGLGEQAGKATNPLTKLLGVLRKAAEIIPGMELGTIIAGVVAGVAALYAALSDDGALTRWGFQLSLVADHLERVTGSLRNAMDELRKVRIDVAKVEDDTDRARIQSMLDMGDVDAADRAKHEVDIKLATRTRDEAKKSVESLESNREKLGQAYWEGEREKKRILASAIETRSTTVDERGEVVPDWDRILARGSFNDRVAANNLRMRWVELETTMPAALRDWGQSARDVETARERLKSTNETLALTSLPQVVIEEPFDLPDNKVNVDARGSRITVKVDRVSTDDPGQFASQSLMAGFRSTVRHTITSDISAPDGR